MAKCIQVFIRIYNSYYGFVFWFPKGLWELIFNLIWLIIAVAIFLFEAFFCRRGWCRNHLFSYSLSTPN